MIANLDGDFETVDYAKNRNLLLYDNIQYFDAILKYIDKNYTSDITLESLADISG